MGLDPRPFSLRELAWMANGRQVDMWNHTAAVLAMQVNTAANKKKGRKAKPKDFHPFTKRTRKLDRSESRQALRRMFGLETQETRDESQETRA